MQVKQLINAIDTGRLSINDFHGQNEFNDRILTGMGKTLIGQGGVGKTYQVGDYVIKQIEPCKFKKDSPARRYCTDIQELIQGNPISKIPGGNGKKRYMLPNLLSEVAIGMILGETEFSYTKTLGSFILSEQGKLYIYIIMDAHQPLLVNQTINSDMGLNLNTLLYLLFQVAHGLLQAQEKYKFTHYDIHIGNILWDKWPQEKEGINYPLPNTDQTISIPKNLCPFLIKIADFGLSRLERKNVMVTPLLDTYPEKSFGEFDPFYDWISFIGSVIFNPMLSSIIYSSSKLTKIITDFILWVFDDEDIIIPDNPTLQDYQQIRENIAYKYYSPGYYFRPKQRDEFVAIIKSKSMVEIVNYLGNVLLKTNLALLGKRKDSINIERLTNKYKVYHNIKAFAPNIPVDMPYFAEETNLGEKRMVIDKGIVVRSIHLLYNSPPKDFNFTIDAKQLQECPLQEHFITAVEISGNKDYRFEFDCCKLDPAKYLRDINRNGLVVNGGFFNIQRDYLPIGPYKDSSFQTFSYAIPKNYQDVYRFIVLKNNTLVIQKENPKNTDKYFATGPILIENGKIVFNPYDKRFACNTQKNVENTPDINVTGLTNREISVDGYYEYDYYQQEGDLRCARTLKKKDQTFLRCDTLAAGELSHADNPNPRTALCILKNGDIVFFAVEGRGKRGIGVDLYNLASSLLISYPNIQTAVNLDGGRSSNIAWRTVNKPNKVYISNPGHLYSYPVGNIISFLKK